MNVGGMRGAFDGMRVIQADRQRLFHHDVHAVAGADFDHAAMVERVRIQQHGLRMRFHQHLFEIGKEQRWIEFVSRSGLGK